MKKYDAILYIDSEPILENDRRNARKGLDASPKYFAGSYDWDDPTLYNQFSFGQSLQSQLNGLGQGFACKVTDFKKWVTVEISYHNIITGRSASKTFLIVFKHKGDGIVLSTHNRYRTISGADQAVSYIRNVAGTIKDSTSSKIG